MGTKRDGAVRLSVGVARSSGCRLASVVARVPALSSSVRRIFAASHLPSLASLRPNKWFRDMLFAADELLAPGMLMIILIFIMMIGVVAIDGWASAPPMQRHPKD